MTEWQTRFKPSVAELRTWTSCYQSAGNTGVLCKFVPGLDLDVTLLEAAEALEALVREHFEEHGHVLVRIGKPPKRLIPLRTDEPFEKLSRIFTAPDGSVQRLEILSDGQQFVCSGVHPDTKHPYTWHGGNLLTVKREDLPYARREDCEAFLTEATKLLTAEFEFVEQSPPQPNGDARRHERVNSRWGELNERALANLDKWVPKLFPTAKRTRNGGYRVKSADLGRGREEDLSLTLKGIKYFGDADMGDPRQGRRTPLDVVMEWCHLEFAAAAQWLEDALGEAPHAAPNEEAAPEPDNQGAASRFNATRFENIRLNTAPAYLVKGIIPRDGLAIVYGPPKCGKSFWVFDLMMHVALGLCYRGRCR